LLLCGGLISANAADTYYFPGYYLRRSTERNIPEMVVPSKKPPDRSPVLPGKFNSEQLPGFSQIKKSNSLFHRNPK
jgi:hypothetical protein